MDILIGIACKKEKVIVKCIFRRKTGRTNCLIYHLICFLIYVLYVGNLYFLVCYYFLFLELMGQFNDCDFLFTPNLNFNTKDCFILCSVMAVSLKVETDEFTSLKEYLLGPLTIGVFVTTRNHVIYFTVFLNFVALCLLVSFHQTKVNENLN